MATMPGPRLPLEMVLLIVDASLKRDGNPRETQSHFEQLRLVNRAVKGQAHQTYRKGVSTLATKAAACLLEPARLASFTRDLEGATRLLRETEGMHFAYEGYTVDEELHESPDWVAGVKAIMAETRQMEGLLVDFNSCGVKLHGLALEELATVRMIWVLNGWKDQLHDLDLSSMPRLTEFQMVGSDRFTMGEPLRFRLPARLTSLVLDQLGMTADDIRGLDVPSFSELRTLRFVHESLGDDSVVALGLPRLHNLRHLDLSSDHSGLPLGDVALGEIRQCTALEELNLNSTNLASVAGLCLHDRNSTIVKLDLGVNALVDPVSLGLASNRSLRALDVSRNMFTSFAFGLATNTTLRTLDLSECVLKAEGIRQLAQQLARNTTLSDLRLFSCGVKDEGMLELRLEKTTGLKWLDLSCNPDVTDEGLGPLLDSIALHELQQLDVSLWQTGASVLVQERLEPKRSR